MKVRARTLVAISLMFIFVLFACAALITALNSLVANAEFTGYGTELSNEELYNNSNTYNVSAIADNKITYNLNTSNGKTVMEESQITVLTPGLGGTAAHWSNAYPNVHKNEDGDDVTYFAYSEDSIIHQLYMKADEDAYVYWAKMYDNDNFNLYDIQKSRVLVQRILCRHCHIFLWTLLKAKIALALLQVQKSGCSHNRY